MKTKEKGSNTDEFLGGKDHLFMQLILNLQNYISLFSAIKSLENFLQILMRKFIYVKHHLKLDFTTIPKALTMKHRKKKLNYQHTFGI